MSVIVGLRRHDSPGSPALLVGDSGWFSGDVRLSTADPKVFLADGCAVGFSGHGIHGHLFRRRRESWGKPFPETREGLFDFFAGLLDQAKLRDRNADADHPLGQMRATWLIATPAGRLFQASLDSSVVELERYGAIGAAWREASGALEAMWVLGGWAVAGGNPHAAPELTLASAGRRAVQAAIRLCVYTAEPIVMCHPETESPPAVAEPDDDGPVSPLAHIGRAE